MFIIKSQKSSLSLGRFGKIGLILSEDVNLQLINSTYAYLVYYYDVDACALTKSVYV